MTFAKRLLYMAFTTMTANLLASCANRNAHTYDDNTYDSITVECDLGDDWIPANDSESEFDKAIDRRIYVDVSELYDNNNNASSEYDHDDINFYDGESYFADDNEVSDEERDEIDQWYGIED